MLSNLSNTSKFVSGIRGLRNQTQQKIKKTLKNEYSGFLLDKANRRGVSLSTMLITDAEGKQHEDNASSLDTVELGGTWSVAVDGERVSAKDSSLSSKLTCASTDRKLVVGKHVFWLSTADGKSLVRGVVESASGSNVTVVHTIKVTNLEDTTTTTTQEVVKVELRKDDVRVDSNNGIAPHTSQDRQLQDMLDLIEVTQDAIMRDNSFNLMEATIKINDKTHESNPLAGLSREEKLGLVGDDLGKTMDVETGILCTIVEEYSLLLNESPHLINEEDFIYEKIWSRCFEAVPFLMQMLCKQASVNYKTAQEPLPCEKPRKPREPSGLVGDDLVDDEVKKVHAEKMMSYRKRLSDYDRKTRHIVSARMKVGIVITHCCAIQGAMSPKSMTEFKLYRTTHYKGR